MCGISCLIGSSVESFSSKIADLQSQLKRRGPDCCADVSLKSCSVQAIFLGSVLHFRGSLTPQPLQDSANNILLWNGEIFGGIEIQSHENDGQVLLTLLQQCSSDTEVTRLLSLIQGPWSLIYWQATKQCLWFGRDAIGRRSLLWGWEKNHLMLSSVARRPWSDEDTDWSEVPANGMYCLQCKHWPSSDEERLEINLFPWQRASSINFITSRGDAASDHLVCRTVKGSGNEMKTISDSSLLLNTPVAPEAGEANTWVNVIDSELSPVTQENTYLNGGVSITISDVGLRCCIPHLNKDLPTNEHLKKLDFFKESKILYASTSPSQFAEPPQASDTSIPIAGKKSRKKCKQKNSNDVPAQQILRFLDDLLQSDPDTKEVVMRFIHLFGEAVRKRVYNVPREENAQDNEQSKDTKSIQSSKHLKEQKRAGERMFEKDNGEGESDEQKKTNATKVNNIPYKDVLQDANPTNEVTEATEHLLSGLKFKQHPDSLRKANVAVLFSGGIDSMIIAAMADRYKIL
ncbi:asparagine synthetase domain-containing protein 1-like, partial [Anneissia japonica]|uniref:asparagine synthetase domain-containing protein 1-like n=1 Tax=Anneissia japonica TaxID=1529436 RepID=UPI001425B306